MNVKQTIQARRAYRSLEPVEITQELTRDLAESAQLTPSCFNNQPWRFVFAHDPEVWGNCTALCRRATSGFRLPQ